MSKVVRLHGGPLHGKLMTVEDGMKKFFIAKPPETPVFVQELTLPDAIVPTRKGTYSQVHLRPTDFEWDGWERP